jgi:hypothetical protein
MTDELHEASPEYYVNTPRKFRFTRENAREMQARGAATKRSRAEKQESAQETSKIASQANDGFSKSALTRVCKQLDAIDKLMNDCKDAKSWDMLSRSKERLFKVFTHLANLPGPGQHRPATPKPAKPRYAAPAEPSESDPGNPPQSTP